MPHVNNILIQLTHSSLSKLLNFVHHPRPIMIDVFIAKIHAAAKNIHYPQFIKVVKKYVNAAIRKPITPLKGAFRYSLNEKDIFMRLLLLLLLLQTRICKASRDHN